MVIGESEAVNQPHQTMGAPQASIDNIMSGISNTGTVKMNNHRKKLRQRFDIIKKLGQGTYGKVQLGINKETGQEVAIKTIKKCKIETEADLIRIRREVQIMSSVQHPNIIHIYEVFENREKMVLVMEFAAGGELYDYLSERKVLSEDEARRVFRQISTAVYYCHKHKICHRDLKLENILLDENGNAKIADFGLSNVFDEQRLLATFCGSPLYASPEIVKGTPYQGPEVDCWSLGVLLYTLVYGAMPFDGSNFKRLVRQISTGDYYEPKKPSPASPLIREMLTVCPKRRATIEQICNHWWVNEGYTESCLDLAEELANQTPVRLDVLLSLAPSAVTSDQLVVPGPVEETKLTDRVARSHSVGSIRDMGGNTEAERRILDMVAAGGEAALAPSPTRTITPSESPAQPKRKLETTISMENAVGIIKKKEKPMDTLEDIGAATLEESQLEQESLDHMDIDPNVVRQQEHVAESSDVNEMKQIEEKIQSAEEPKLTKQIKDLNAIEEMCNELLNEPPKEATATPPTTPEKRKVFKKKVIKTDPAQDTITEEKTPTKKSPIKTVKKIIKKPVSDPAEKPNDGESSPKIMPERKVSLTDENKPTERRKSRVFEAAEKFQNANAQANDKLKKIIIPGVSVGSFKKEFERKASLTNSPPVTMPEKKFLEKRESNSSTEQPSDSRKSSIEETETIPMSPILDSKVTPPLSPPASSNEPIDNAPNELIESESKSSIASFSLEEARRSMENSIALLNQARTESNKELEQLCAKTESVAVSNDAERMKKLKNAREIIGNAIPVGRLGVRKPPVPFGVNGRSSSGSVVPSSTLPVGRPIRSQGSDPTSLKNVTFNQSNITPKLFEREPLVNATAKVVPIEMPVEPIENPTTKTSRAEITLKSATLPRRKTTKAEIQLDIQPKAEPSMRFQTEMQHQVPDLRSAPIHEHSTPYSPLSIQQRATSLDPQSKKEFVIPIQRAVFTPNTTIRPTTVSRQSTIESDAESSNVQIQSPQIISSSNNNNNQPIKKSPREFIIPIAVEGVGYVTPRAGSLEPSESSFNTNTTFSRLGRPRRMGSLLSDRDSEDESSFHKMHRHTSIGRESDNDEPRFAMHRLRTTRPIKKIAQDPNDSASSGEDDDEDGFEILTAENLFSTLLSRVRALTNRLNVNNNTGSGFPTSRFMSNMRQPHSPFWNHDPFTSRLSNGSGPWRHSLARDFGTDMDSMISRSGATLPRGTKNKTSNNNNHLSATISTQNDVNEVDGTSEKLDLADLDLSRLRLTKKDLETLSSITPELPKHFQDQLLAQLPPNQARKLSRTLSMQNNSATAPVKVYKRSLSGGREPSNNTIATNEPLSNNCGNEPNITKSIEEDIFDRYSSIRRSISRSKERSTSRCLSSDEFHNNNNNNNNNNNSSLRSSLSSEVSEKYRSCNPSSADSSLSTQDTKLKTNFNGTVSPFKYYDTLPPPRRSYLSPTKEYSGRPPSGFISPPPLRSDSPPSRQRQRSTQRTISRFLRPDFFDTPREESSYVKDKKQREFDTQAVLKEIRERSRERSLDRHDRSTERLSDRSYYSNIDPKCMRERRKSSIPNIRSSFDPSFTSHMRNRSVDRCLNFGSSDTTVQRATDTNNKPRDSRYNGYFKLTEKTSSFADKILGELQHLSLKQLPDSSDTKTPDTKQSSSENKSEEISKKDKTAKPKKLIKSRTSDAAEENSKTIAVNNMKMVTSFTNEIDSVLPVLPKISTDKPKRTSKLVRPKSYPSKEPDPSAKKPSPERMEPVKENPNTSSSGEISKTDSIKSERPKSYPYSKITPPKETNKFCKNGTAFAMDKSSSSSGNSVVKTVTKIDKDKNAGSAKTSVETTPAENVATIKKIKIIKKTIKPEPIVHQTQPQPSSIEQTKEKPIVDKEVALTPKEKSPEKKVNRGFLYTIGQKFEKLRENSKNKEKKPINKTTTKADAEEKKTVAMNETIATAESIKRQQPIDVSHPIKNTKTIQSNEDSKPIERKSRIDTMIRNLRERSLPRGPALTESGLIKRAVSVEDMTGTFNRCTVNRVLGLFKKIEKEHKVENTKSSNNIESLMVLDNHYKERPKSGGFVSKLKKGRAYTGAKSDSIVMLTDQLQKQIDADQMNGNLPKLLVNPNSCQNCTNEKELVNVTKRHSTTDTDKSLIDKERMKNNRRGLVLDLGRLDKIAEPDKMTSVNSSLLNHKNISNNNNNNNSNSNNNYMQNNIGEMQTPSYDSITNYSSDSRSLHDDCASTSTFLSPTDEPELYFDDWSVCSEDNFAGATSTPSISRLSRNSQAPSPISSGTNCSESVIDRIKRRSFYSRFNDKPKRQYNGTVGATGTSASREYYREVTSKLKTRPTERLTSPSINTSEPYRSHSVTNHHSDSVKSLGAQNSSSSKHSYVDELRNYRPCNYNLPPPYSSSSSKGHLVTSNDYKYKTDYFSLKPTSKSSIYDTPSTAPMYGTYNPNRRTSSVYSTTNGGSTNLDTYATLGKNKQRPYNHRSISLLDSSSSSVCNNSTSSAVSYRKDSRGTPDFGNIIRPNYRIRTPSIPRSPTNI